MASIIEYFKGLSTQTIVILVIAIVIIAIFAYRYYSKAAKKSAGTAQQPSADGLLDKLEQSGAISTPEAPAETAK